LALASAALAAVLTRDFSVAFVSLVDG